MDNTDTVESYDPKAGFPINIKNWILTDGFKDSIADFVTDQYQTNPYRNRTCPLVKVCFDKEGTSNMPIYDDTINNVIDKLVKEDPSIVNRYTHSTLEDLAIEIIGRSRQTPLVLTRMDLVEAFSTYAEVITTRGYIVTDTPEFREAFEAVYPKIHALFIDPELDDTTPIKFVDSDCELMSEVIVDIVDAYVRTTHPEYDAFCPLIYNFINTPYDVRGGRRVIINGDWDN